MINKTAFVMFTLYVVLAVTHAVISLLVFLHKLGVL
jgi:hypothetical protein